MAIVYVTPWALIAWGIILSIIVGLALHVFETPVSRALTLGLLQALYVMMGASSGRLSLSVGVLAAVFFFSCSAVAA